MFGDAKGADRFQFIAAGHRELKGFSQPVRLYRVRRPS
jgi:class 3 adenylate cyclase